MFEAGNLLYFNPFYFHNGNKPKPKYCIVLANLGDVKLIASLPTSKDHIPSFIDKEHGCINSENHNVNCYYFSALKMVCNDTQFHFPRETYVYGSQVHYMEMEVIKEQHFDLQDIVYCGKLNENEFEAIKSCFRNSAEVKRGIKRHL